MDKKNAPDKKPWRKPELIVLVRSQPEEAVLITCKTNGATGPVGSKCKNKGARCMTIKNS